jgi:cobalamin biosynthesis protein CobT
VLAKKAGTAIITAYTDSGASSDCVVTVQDATLDNTSASEITETTSEENTETSEEVTETTSEENTETSEEVTETTSEENTETSEKVTETTSEENTETSEKVTETAMEENISEGYIPIRDIDDSIVQDATIDDVDDDSSEVTKKLTAPKSLKVTSPKKGNLKISWRKVTSASRYRVYYSTKKKGTYKVLANTTKTSITKKLKSKKVYYIKVVAIGRTGTVGKYSSIKRIKVK